MKLSQYVVQMLCTFTENCLQRETHVSTREASKLQCMPGHVVIINLYPKDVVAANEIHTVCCIQT